MDATTTKTVLLAQIKEALRPEFRGSQRTLRLVVKEEVYNELFDSYIQLQQKLKKRKKAAQKVEKKEVLEYVRVSKKHELAFSKCSELQGFFEEDSWWVAFEREEVTCVDCFRAPIKIHLEEKLITSYQTTLSLEQSFIVDEATVRQFTYTDILMLSPIN